MFDAAELVGVEEAIRCHMELEPCADDLLYDFFCCIEQDNGAEEFWCVVGGLVGLGYDNQCSSCELGRLTFILDAHICDDDNFF